MADLYVGRKGVEFRDGKLAGSKPVRVRFEVWQRVKWESTRLGETTVSYIERALERELEVSKTRRGVTESRRRVVAVKFIPPEA